MIKMVEVRFACIPGLGGVECTLNGVTKVSDGSGIASFFDISQGEHSYSVKAPIGMAFQSGKDVFNRPLFRSGTTNIEWLPLPGTPYPEDQPWVMAMTFVEGTEPPQPPVPSEDLIQKIVAVSLLGGLIVWFSYRA